MTKRPYILADSVFDSLPPERQAEILRGVDRMIADNMPDKPAKKTAGGETIRPAKTSKRKVKGE